MTWLAEHSLDILRWGDMRIFNMLVRLNGFLGKGGEETFGVVMLRRHGGTANVLLTFANLRYRDCSPAEFVWRRSGLQATARCAVSSSRPEWLASTPTDWVSIQSTAFGYRT